MIGLVRDAAGVLGARGGTMLKAVLLPWGVLVLPPLALALGPRPGSGVEQALQMLIETILAPLALGLALALALQGAIRGLAWPPGRGVLPLTLVFGVAVAVLAVAQTIAGIAVLQRAMGDAPALDRFAEPGPVTWIVATLLTESVLTPACLGALALPLGARWIAGRRPERKPWAALTAALLVLGLAWVALVRLPLGPVAMSVIVILAMPIVPIGIAALVVAAGGLGPETEKPARG